MWGCSLFFTPSPAFIACRLLDSSHSDWHVMVPHWGLDNDNPICKTEKEIQMYRTEFWTLWEKARVGCFERIELKQVYYQGWVRSPAQVGCMRQVLRAGALGGPGGMGWGRRREGGSEWGTHVNLWLIHISVWQKPLQYCGVINLQLIKINGKKFKISNLSLIINPVNTATTLQFYVTCLFNF